MSKAREIAELGQNLTVDASGNLGFSGDIELGDNNKAIFGAGGDLEIYHTGSASIIRDAGAGNLSIQAEDFAVQSSDGSATHIFVDTSTGYTSLSFGGSTKINTASTGINVTGTVTADGLTVDGGASLGGVGYTVLLHTNSNVSPVYFSRSTVTDQALAIGIDDNDVFLNSIQDEQYGGFEFQSTYDGTGTQSRLSIANNGAISFYEDTGTTPKFRWDASAERLGIGTISPTGDLTIGGGSPRIDFLESDGSAGFDNTILVRGADVFSIQTRNGGTFVSNDYRMTTDASGALTHEWRTGNVERMRITSTGSVGIGTSNPGTTRLMAVASSAYSAAIQATSDSSALNWARLDIKNSNVAAPFILYQDQSGNSVVRSDTAAGSLAFATNGANERMRIDSSGNVGIGTSSPATKLDVQGDGLTVRLDGTANTSRGILLRNTGTAEGVIQTDGNMHFLQEDASRVMKFSTANTERLRIDSSGNLLVGTTGSLVAGARVRASSIAATFEGEVTHAGGSGAVLWANRTSSDGWVAAWYRGGSSVGSISVTSSSTAYNTSSDYRLKENVVAMTGATDRLKQLNPSRFNFIADAGTTVDGFLAHEVQSIVPEAITGTKDAVDADGNPEYQGIDQSKLVPLLTAALQEALTEIADLKARITALEAQP